MTCIQRRYFTWYWRQILTLLQRQKLTSHSRQFITCKKLSFPTLLQPYVDVMLWRQYNLVATSCARWDYLSWTDSIKQSLLFQALDAVFSKDLFWQIIETFSSKASNDALFIIIDNLQG